MSGKSIPKEISRLNEIILGLNDTPTISLKLTRTEGEMFRMKTRTKGSGKNINTQSNCEYPECNSTDVDTIRCNLCARWVYKGCQDASVAKLKQIFNKCKTIYFLCQTCDQLQSEHSREAVINYNPNIYVKLLHRSTALKPIEITIV